MPRTDAAEGRVEARVTPEATDRKRPIRSTRDGRGSEVTDADRDPSV